MNLYVARAELSARQFEEDPQSFRTEVARFCGVRRPEEPGSRSAGVPHQGMHNRGSVHQAGEGADTALEDYDLPELVDADATAEEDDTWDDQEEYITDSEMNASQELEGDREDDGVTDADATAEEDDTRDDQEEYVTDSEMNTSQELEGDREDDGDIDLDSGHADGSEHVSIYRTGASQDFSEMDLTNDDLEELAVDLEREHTELSKEDDVMIAELDDIAKELEREQSEGDLSLTEKPTRVTRAGSSAKRTAAMSSAFASSLAGPGLAAGLSSSRIANSAINRPAFSTASSARRSSGPPAGRPKDEFEQVLGMGRGALWRDALRGDDARMHAAVHGPLSRGYRNETTPVAELTGKSAVDMGLEDVRAACKEAQLSDAVTQDVEDALRGNGPLYQIELENALRSRLRTDPDYEPDKFPATARRFGGSL